MMKWLDRIIEGEMKISRAVAAGAVAGLLLFGFGAAGWSALRAAERRTPPTNGVAREVCVLCADSDRDGLYLVDTADLTLESLLPPAEGSRVRRLADGGEFPQALLELEEGHPTRVSLRLSDRREPDKAFLSSRLCVACAGKVYLAADGGPYVLADRQRDAVLPLRPGLDTCRVSGGSYRELMATRDCLIFEIVF